ncbi:MAG: hypothetical protein IJT32_05680 [Lachnospiraceae bacterium]|nr:hypothetical protein [Lachnospiraceae bacterium]
MDINSLSSVTSSIATSGAYTSKETTKADPEKETKKTANDVAAVYEKSSDTASAKTKNTSKNAGIDRDAIIAKMKSDMESQKAQLFDIVKNSISGQGKSFGMATEDDMWKFLAGGDFTVDAATKAQAQADIAEDGYWGVDQTSDRILDFAKALAGNDPDKAEEFLDAFKKGFKEATKTWGKDLPDISSKTYDAVVEKFDKWKNGEE